MSSPPSSPKPDHLAVLVHGLWGHPKHLNYVRDTLRQQYPPDQLHILVASSIGDNKTYDGIEVGGERVAHEIEEKIAELERERVTIRKISITGYSLGGLISRYAIGLLYGSGLFDRIQPVNFSTFATPHLGVRAPKRGMLSSIFNYMGPKTLSASGQQMFLVDTFRDTGKPLLSIMADPNSIFIRGLSLFKNKWLYANTINDRSVPYYTSSFSRTDPFVDLDKIEVHYASSQPAPGNVILDPDHPVSPRPSPWDDMTTFEYLQTAPLQVLKDVPYHLLLASLLTIAMPIFILNTSYQSYQSSQRIRLHESGTTFRLDRYRIKFLEAQNRAYEHLAGGIASEEYLPTPPPEATSSSSPDSERSDLELSRRETTREKSSNLFPILALTEEQFDMIESLDKLGFVKFPVHITNVRHTHAAMVVRMQRESFAEGKVVVQHWAERFEV